MDDALGAAGLTGRRAGFYRHRCEWLGAFPVTAELVQEGDRIRGEMFDQATERSSTFDDLLAHCGDDISPGNRRRMQAAVDRFGPGAVVRTSRLPDGSDIDGVVSGDLVRFTKTYRGDMEVNVTVAGSPFRSLRWARHRVHYSGRLDRGAVCIAGDWVIRRSGLLGRLLPPAGRGTFELYRKP
jgi:hypothetical protein